MIMKILMQCFFTESGFYVKQITFLSFAEPSLASWCPSPFFPYNFNFSTASLHLYWATRNHSHYASSLFYSQICCTFKILSFLEAFPAFLRSPFSLFLSASNSVEIGPSGIDRSFMIFFVVQFNRAIFKSGSKSSKLTLEGFFCWSIVRQMQTWKNEWTWIKSKAEEVCAERTPNSPDWEPITLWAWNWAEFLGSQSRYGCLNLCRKESQILKHFYSFCENDIPITSSTYAQSLQLVIYISQEDFPMPYEMGFRLLSTYSFIFPSWLILRTTEIRKKRLIILQNVISNTPEGISVSIVQNASDTFTKFYSLKQPPVRIKPCMWLNPAVI